MNRRVGLTVHFALWWALLGAGSSGPAWSQPSTGTEGMVVASQADAADAGLAMLEAGGNAVDAAVATA
ncbi:MAG: gamma-glutamyltransferase, partial [Myxococcota bacterium]|nr:gamma-glutamyltransferase [Myxococcota bacterium]